MNRTLARIYDASCRAKVRFVSPQEAERERQRHGYVLYVYSCKWCSGFHLTRQPQQRNLSA
jgi:hypothetical protein